MARRLQLLQLGRRVGVDEGGGIVERHFDRAVQRRPAVDLAPAALGEARETFQQAGVHQAEHRLHLRPVGCLRHRHRDLGVGRLEPLRQARHEVFRKQRRIARHRDEPGRLAAFEPDQEAGQRAGEVRRRVRHTGTPMDS
jgi:hypothetical protein